MEKEENGGLEPVKKINKFDKFFGITASGSNFKTEIIAGVTTFMAMVYALLVVPGMYEVGGSFTHVSFTAL